MGMRLDAYMVKNNLASAREKAKEYIKSDCVTVNSIVCNKPSAIINDDDKVIFVGEKLKYVGRGGLKLEKAIDVFNIDLKDKICADIGASTGGFTDCMLMNNAKKVYSVDVGHGQLADKLLNDKRVVNLEGKNARELSSSDIQEKLHFISIDVSFISLKLVLPSVIKLLDESGELVCLIKPQFEAGKQNIGKKGVVKSLKVHKDVLNELLRYFQTLGLYTKNIDYSPIKGPEGNIEYLAYLSVKPLLNQTQTDINSIVAKAFAQLK